MARVLLIRHAKTDWNLKKRLQGRRDIPLCDAGRRQIEDWRIDGFEAATFCSSPLVRARETARLLFGRDALVDPRLIEMDWGEFEGCSLNDLRNERPDEMAKLEARGIHFQPPGGERPIDVAERLQSFLADLGEADEDAVAIAHKGQLHAAMILAFDWRMDRKPPLRFGANDGFLLEIGGEADIDRLETVSLCL